MEAAFEAAKQSCVTTASCTEKEVDSIYHPDFPILKGVISDLQEIVSQKRKRKVVYGKLGRSRKS